MAKSIFITGCAKSGTTLLRRLFYAFDGLLIINREIDLKSFIELAQQLPGRAVAKRDRGDLLSFDHDETRSLKMFRAAQRENISIINIYRDGRDVVVSDNSKAHAYRWVSSIRQMIALEGRIALNIRYENLVQTPDAEQQKAIDALGLKPNYKWSQYPDFVPAAETGKGIYRLRPLSMDSIGKGRFSYHKNVVYCKSSFEDCLEALGYE